MPVVEKATLPQSSPSQANGLSAPDSITSGQQSTKPRLREDEQKLPLLIGLGIVYAIVFWWFSTAAIIYFNFQPAYRGIVFGIALALLIMALYVLHAHRESHTIGSAFLTFTAGSIVWAFVEISFYTGFIVGPQVRPIFTVGPSLIGFFKAIHRSLYHEALVLGLVGIMIALLFKSKNRFGAYTFLMYWFMHQSAKLNIFLGVANTGREFVPDTVADMTQYMTIAHMNWLFPFSITFCTLLVARLFQKVREEHEAWRQVGFAIIGTMALMALLEHWLLVLPLNQSLWDIVIKRLH
ncbi:MAG: putative photosynthetic complex assembly protein PuhE [Chloroherpetonaceae bacterium]|nr:putative photosynthetic complex assembly protein PuhE [Chloroherpetonaceae bacterium]MCS7211961.1 putative photosynthetic complex assembly protein PuhE [Chloroherpetonaceae bacterium]MDW8020901.1 putative photosynthetic complex assembly protein PuhE [Chloroherpetonaceae bacterium]